MRPKLRVGPEFLFKVVTWGQERGNFLLHGMSRIHLSAPKDHTMCNICFEIPWKDNFGMERQNQVGQEKKNLTCKVVHFGEP